MDGQTDGRCDFNMPRKFLRGHKKKFCLGGGLVGGRARVNEFFFTKNPNLKKNVFQGWGWVRGLELVNFFFYYESKSKKKNSFFFCGRGVGGGQLEYVYFYTKIPNRK